MKNQDDVSNLLKMADIATALGNLLLQEKEDGPEEPSCDQSDDSEMPHDTSYCDSVINLLQQKVTSLKLRNQELDDRIVALEEENVCLVDELEKQSNIEEVLMDAIKILANKVNRDSKLLASMESYQASLEAFVAGLEEQNALFKEINAEQKAEIDELKAAIIEFAPDKSLKSMTESCLSIPRAKRNWFASFRNLSDLVLFLKTRKMWYEQH